MIDVKNLTKSYGRVLAVDGVSFHIERGTVVGFLGPNGAGKSTTLKILTCFLPATSGKATIANHDVFTESLEVRKLVGYMPESVPLYPEMRVREYLNFRAALRNVPRRERRKAIDRVAEQCWLSKPENMMRRRLGELSRGYKQRVGLAEVLLHDPQVLILDEPTIGLDPAQIRSMRELITDLGHERTVILSSHILAEVEQTCNQLIIIAGGKIAATGTPGELRRRVSGPSRIIAEVRTDDDSDPAEKIRKIDGVDKVESVRHGGWMRLSISGKSDDDLRESIYNCVRQNEWRLREIRKEVGSLEDFFVQITYEQNVGTGKRLTELSA